MGGGRHWGNLYYLKNIVYIRLASYELNPFQNFWSKSFRHMKRDFFNFGALAAAAYGSAHVVIHLADAYNEKISRKNPADYENDE